ncbi:MAG: NAD(P)-dependent oxidoreductase [Draconibacterium sp.]|nr:MAG: NAD(P)-dependent oxidoreductase [Draconibacterium sp.]
MYRTALITGATSGIGKATAQLLAKNGFRIIVTGRRKDRLLALKEKIEKEANAEVYTLNFDIRDLKQTNTAIESLPLHWQNIDVLINNAGLAVGLNALHEGIIDDWERMIDTNVKGLLYITRKVAPKMVEKGSGHIINISSIAGIETYPYGNVYCATKHAVQSLTKAMRLEMLKNGIKVSSIEPGAVETEFSEIRFKGDKERAKNTYAGFNPLKANDIADTVLFVLTRPSHVNIDSVLIMPTDQAFSRDFNRSNK